MATTTFIDGQTRIEASWLNDVDEKVYGLKSYGAIGDGITNDTTAYTTFYNDVTGTGKTAYIPKGNYLIGGVNYVVKGPFYWTDHGFGAVDIIGQAETASILLTSKTEDSSPADAKKAHTTLSITADIYGSHHGNAARFNAVSRSDNADGCTSVYAAGNTTAENNWMAAIHSEIKHGGGTTIGSNVECASYETTGTFIGLNVQNTTDSAVATHPQTGLGSVEFVESEAITIRGGTTAKGKWKYGIWIKSDGIKTNAMASGSTAIRIDSSSTYGIYTAAGSVNSVADIILQGDSDNGLICNGNYTNCAIRLKADNHIGWDVTGTLKTSFISADDRWALVNNTTEKVGLDINTGSIYILGEHVVGTRKTGWAAATGTATRTTFATTTVTTAQLAQRVKALIDDLILHGLIGT